MSQINGHISQIIGPVIDVFFDTQGQDPEKVLPKIYEAMTVKRPDGRDLVLEVEQHIGEDTVRCIAMDSTDGLERGLEVKPLGAPIQMPSGDQIRGRMMNVIGQPIDGMKPLSMEGSILSTVRLLNLRTCQLTKRCYPRVSRSSTCWNLTCEAARSVCSVVPV